MAASRSTASRLGLLRSIAHATRSAARPGSAGLPTRLAALPRMWAAVRTGQYTGTSTGVLVGLVAAAAYLLSPVDLMPEGVLGVFGLGDDAFVLAWLASTLVNSTEDFLGWERATGGASAGPATARSTSRGAQDVLVGDVVR